MFLLVLVTCVTLEGQTMCHEFKREQAYANQDACLMAAAMERGRYNLGAILDYSLAHTS